MKKKIIFCAIILSGAFLNACEGINTKGPKQNYRSYVTEYYDINNIIIYAYSDIDIVKVAIRPTTTYADIDMVYSSTHFVDRYDALCIKHGDMSFNKNIHMWEYRCYAVDFESISIISDADFDNQHLAGTSLNDLFMFSSVSIYPFIKSGYEGFAPMHTSKHETQISKRVFDLVPEDMMMISDYSWPSNVLPRIATLTITAAPIIAKIHNITVTMTTDDNRVFSDTVEVIWE